MDQQQPQISADNQIFLSKHTFRKFGYFSAAQYFIPHKDIELCINKLYQKCKLAKIKRGTVLYMSGSVAQQCYFLIRGKVQLLKKKNNKQKLETYPNHMQYSLNQKLNYLKKNYNIEPSDAQQLINQFYQEKVVFKYLPYRTICSQQQFGFPQMYRNSTRPFTAIATVDTQLIVIDTNTFDQCVRDFQYKKQSSYLSKILQNFSQKQVDELKLKLSQIFTTSILRVLDNQDILYKQSSLANFLYFIFQGECQLYKNLILEIPKKFQNQNKGLNKRQIQIKVNKLSSGCFIGDYQILMSSKIRQFTVKCTINKTIILQIQPGIFARAFSDSIEAEKQLVTSANRKHISAMQIYQKQKAKIQKKFLSQYQEYENRKKQKILSGFLHQGAELKNKFYQVFSQEGLFYRDTFQKLKGFDFSKTAQVSKRNTIIKRTKAKKSQSQQNQQIKDQQMSLAAQQKLLFSPKATLTTGQFFKNSQNNQQSQQKKIKIRKSSRSTNKFQQLKIDQETYKRVMIKHGIYPKDRKTDKSNIVKPIANHNFDGIVKQCISRKHPLIRKVIDEKKQALIRQTYQKMTKTLKNKSLSISKFSNFATPCKGTQQMRKRMQTYKNIRTIDQSTAARTFFPEKALQQCIGVNEKPKSSQINFRSQTLSRYHKIQVPQRIVLLNHMMKPITYISPQI